ncbi:hypothetical protein H8K32_07975 [Undibacterium jejuense]|uniref:Uncharacterized protein n=1 Tax=Undibacterium jejuense TaxID=1344949 RepID=A0A923HE06_9BURK|nr:hypothetical protein [Undibacterium jejuense]MBC3862029.1 hypothetical protein [Undibacterium jejuense]
MKMPLIIDENGDVSIYWSLKDAEQSIEAIDIQHNEYAGYDATGRLLSFSVKDFRTIQICVAENMPSHVHELIVALRRFIEARMKWANLDDFSLDELLQSIEVNGIKN